MRKKMKKKDDKLSLFMETFWSEYVEILLKQNISHTEATEEGAVNSQSGPISVRGFVLDEDSNFIYLGEDIENKAVRAVERSTIAVIEVVEPQESLENILDDLIAPEKEEEFN